MVPGPLFILIKLQLWWMWSITDSVAFKPWFIVIRASKLAKKTFSHHTLSAAGWTVDTRQFGTINLCFGHQTVRRPSAASAENDQTRIRYSVWWVGACCSCTFLFPADRRETEGGLIAPLPQAWTCYESWEAFLIVLKSVCLSSRSPSVILNLRFLLELAFPSRELLFTGYSFLMHLLLLWWKAQLVWHQ